MGDQVGGEEVVENEGNGLMGVMEAAEGGGVED